MMEQVGTVQGQSIVLDESPGLPDGTRVRIHLEVVRPELSVEEKLVLVEATCGMFKVSPEALREVMEIDPYDR